MDLLPRPNSPCSTAFACSPGAGLALAATMMLDPGCAEPPVHDRPSPTGRIEQLAADLQQDNPWPEIREERIRLLLPQAMEAAGVDSWIVLCRENHNDPLAKHIGGEDAGPLAAFLFLHPPSGLEPGFPRTRKRARITARSGARRTSPVSGPAVAATKSKITSSFTRTFFRSSPI